MKRTVKLFSALLAVLLLFAALSRPACADEGSMTVTTVIPCTVTLSIGENGSVTADNTTYTGDASFQADPDTVLIYTITPEKGYEIDCVTYNGEDVMSSVAEGSYTAPALTGNAELIVTFAPAAHVHEWEDDYTVDREPSCTEEGSKSIHCKGCDEVKDSTAIPALGHAWDSGVVTKKATETEAGQIKYTCTRCGAVRYEKIPPKSSPKTGDGRPVGLWVGLLCLSGAVMAALLIRRRRKAGN